MTHEDIPILPYHLIVGQRKLRLALEIAYVVPGVGGVLATGERGTAKSTTVRSFARMVLGRLPVTLPIGATDDRVLGGWDVERLLDDATAKIRPGLLHQAQHEGGGLLYIDEVNLLDDYLVNVILDAAAGGVLPVEREGIGDQALPVRFNLVGTMNPEEGYLRPQLLDRFGLVAEVASDVSPAARRAVLSNVLEFEADSSGRRSERVAKARTLDMAKAARLEQAREAAPDIELPDHIKDLCADAAASFGAVGHRGELTIARAARAVAAVRQAATVRPEHVAEVVPLALVHRRAGSDTGAIAVWTGEDQERLAELVGQAAE